MKNVDSKITAREFFNMFEEIGEVSSSKLEVDDLGASKEYGYVNFESAKSADLAIEKMVNF